MLRLFKAGLTKISLFLHYMNSVVIIPALVLIIFSDICLRTFSRPTFSWSHEVAGLLLLLIFFCSLPHCYIKNEFLTVDFISKYLPERFQALTQLFCYLLVGWFSVLFSWQAWLGFLDMRAFEEEAYSIAMPLWPFSITISVCTCLIGLYTIIQVLDKSWLAKQS